MENKIVEVINVLCEKLGTTAQYIIPEMGRMKIISNIYCVIAWGLITSICCAVTYMSMKKYNDEGDDYYMLILFVTGLLAILGFVMVGISGEQLIMWIVSPTAKAVLEITRMIK